MSVSTEINRIKAAVTAIVNAIKNKGVTVPTTAKVSDLATYVSSIPTGTDTSDATATAANILSGKTAYVKGSKITGTMKNNSTVEKTLGILGDGSWVKSYTIPAGYHDGTSNVVINTQSVTVTPRKNPQSITPVNGNVISDVQVYGDANLIASNIKKGVTIFGVVGTYEGEKEEMKTCTLSFNTYYAYGSVTVTYIKNGTSTTTVIPEYSDVSIEVDCNTSITISCPAGRYVNYSPWGNNIVLSSTLTTPAEPGTYDITFDNS